MRKRYIWSGLYAVLLIAFTVYTLLDTFVIPRAYVSDISANTDLQQVKAQAESQTQQEAQAENSASENESAAPKAGAPGSAKHGSGRKREASDEKASNSDTPQAADTQTASGSSYNDENISITLTEYRENDTAIYVADVTVSSPEYLKTAFAQNTYGRNITEKTSEIAQSSSAILAINGDFYGAQTKGYVIRNGVLYRDTASENQQDLVIFADGSFEIINEDEISAAELLQSGARQVLSFGPALVTDGSISITEGEEVGKAKASNPRTAIGIIDDCHYLFVVADGRTDESAGLSLYQLAEFMQGLGADIAYNLDGGGSSTMVFNGQVINKPTTGGNSIKERSVSDIVYIG